MGLWHLLSKTTKTHCTILHNLKVETRILLASTGQFTLWCVKLQIKNISFECSRGSVNKVKPLHTALCRVLNIKIHHVVQGLISIRLTIHFASILWLNKFWFFFSKHHRMLTISSSWIWICLCTSAIWNNTSPAGRRQRGRKDDKQTKEEEEDKRETDIKSFQSLSEILITSSCKKIIWKKNTVMQPHRTDERHMLPRRWTGWKQTKLKKKQDKNMQQI